MKKRNILVVLCCLVLLQVILVGLRSGLGNTFLLFLGVFVALCVYTYFFETLRKWRWLNYLIIISVVLYVGLGAFAVIYGRHDTATFEEELVIVLGSGIRDGEPSSSLRYRLEAAVEYHMRNPYATVVVSGGVGGREILSEAEVMARFLIANGVPSDLIVLEGNSHSTYQNMRLSKGLIEGNPSVVVITNDFHIYRGTRFARIVGFDEITSFHAPTPLYAVAGSVVREVAAIVKLWVLGT